MSGRQRQGGRRRRTPLTLADGYVLPSRTPGIGIDWDEDALENLRVA